MVLFEYTKDDFKLVYINDYKKFSFFVLSDSMIDYKKQIFIIGIKINKNYLICHILPKEKELITEL